MTSEHRELERHEREAIAMESGPDLHQARLYIETLTSSPDSRVTFQTFDDNPERKAPHLARVLNGSLNEHALELERLNRAGAGSFIAVNETDLRGRKAENIISVRAVFSDFDAGAPAGYALDPSFLVESRRGPQAYWLLEAETPLDRFTPAQLRLAAFYGSDPKVADVSRVMRLPGFFHQKSFPFLVTFAGGSMKRYTLGQVLAAHPVNATSETPLARERSWLDLDAVLAGVPEGARDDTLYRYACRLRGKNLDRAEAEALLLAAARACKPAFPDREAMAKVDRAWKFRAGADGSLDNSATSTHSAAAGSRDAFADWIRPGEGLSARPVPMARVSLFTVFPTLDRNTRGGLPTGGTVGVLGGPDTGKTGMAMAFGDVAENQGFIVIHLTNDNGREAAEIRWGQMMGFDRTKLEEGEPDELARFRAKFATRNIYMPDPDLCNESLEPINTLVHVIDVAKRRFQGKRVFLLVDSTQKIVPDGETYESPRLRVIATMNLIRKAASNPGWLVVAATQINREAFKHKKESKNIDPIAAGAESAGIEFGFDLMLFLSVADEGIRARVTKNKPGAGRKPTLGVIWDKERARASEPDPGSFADEAFRIAEQARKQLWEKLEAIVGADPGLSTKRVQEKARGHREADVTNALEAMAAASPPRLVMQRRGNGKYWFPVNQTSVVPGQPGLRPGSLMNLSAFLPDQPPPTGSALLGAGGAAEGSEAHPPGGVTGGVGRSLAEVGKGEEKRRT